MDTSTWKGTLMLAGAAGVVILGVLGLARLTVPDIPTFAEGFADASAAGDGSLDFVPNVMGGELIISGDREGTLSLEDAVFSDTFGLGNNQGKLFFAPNPLQVTQMSFQGLEFFPEPEECRFSTGEANDERGLVAVRIECAELSDIRDNGTITVEGYLALPVYLIDEADIPQPGGEILVGDEIWDIDEAVSFQAFAEGERSGLSLFPSDAAGYMAFVYNDDHGLDASVLGYGQDFIDLSPDDCVATIGEPIVAGPLTVVIELDFTCPEIDIPGLGTVTIEGHVVFEQDAAVIGP